MRQLVLASTSPYREQLLRQLQYPFLTASPHFEERIDPSVAPELLVRHLALGKAVSLRDQFPDALVIGSDQVFVDQRGRALGKPGSPAAAEAQLRQMSGRTHTFYTGLALVDNRDGNHQSNFATYSVTLRELTDEQIANYVRRENPVNCAGSFKIEGLGITLMERMEGDDYNSLIGLPLIKLVTMLEQFGVHLLEG
jgi:septum formation protein